MSTLTFTIFKRIGAKGWHVFDGHMDSIEQARVHGHLSYKLDSQPAKITLFAANRGIGDNDDDDRTVVGIDATAGWVAPNNDQVLLVAESEISVSGYAAVLGLGTRIEASKRVKDMGWKFTDASGAKYKWTVDKRLKQWELQSVDGNAVATFSGGFFDTQGLGHLSIATGTDLDTLPLIVITWALVARGIVQHGAWKELNRSRIGDGFGGSADSPIFGMSTFGER